MTDTSSTETDGKEPLSPTEKLKAKRHNERMKLLATLFQSLALAVFGLSVLRYLLDPAAQPLPMNAVGFAAIGTIASEITAIYLVGNIKAES